MAGGIGADGVTAGGKLPVLATVLRGWTLLASKWLTLLRILWLPACLIVVPNFYFAASWDHWVEISRSYRISVDAIYRLEILRVAFALLMSGLALALWQRSQIGGRKFSSVLELLSALPNIVSLTLHWCGLIFVTLGLQWVFASPLGTSAKAFLSDLLVRKMSLINHPSVHRALMDMIVSGVPLLIALYIPGRLGLMLWARPAGDPMALDKAWEASIGNGWRIATAIFLAILPIMIANSTILREIRSATGLIYPVYWPDFVAFFQVIVAGGVIAVVSETLLGSREKSAASPQ